MGTVISVEGDEARFRPAAAGIAEPRAWAPLLVPRARIDDAIVRLQDLDKGSRRAIEVIHPEAIEPGPGLAPGLSFSVNVLNPGEQVTIDRDNANRVESAIVGGRTLRASKWDIWNIPSMTRRHYS